MIVIFIRKHFIQFPLLPECSEFYKNLGSGYFAYHWRYNAFIREHSSIYPIRVYNSVFVYNIWSEHSTYSTFYSKCPALDAIYYEQSFEMIDCQLTRRHLRHPVSIFQPHLLVLLVWQYSRTQMVIYHKVIHCSLVRDSNRGRHFVIIMSYNNSRGALILGQESTLNSIECIQPSQLIGDDDNRLSGNKMLSNAQFIIFYSEKSWCSLFPDKVVFFCNLRRAQKRHISQYFIFIDIK